MVLFCSSQHAQHLDNGHACLTAQVSRWIKYSAECGLKFKGIIDSGNRGRSVWRH